MLDDLDFLSEMDKLFGRAAAKPAVKKPFAKPVAKPAEPEYWHPTSVELHIGNWQCTCGQCGSLPPRLFLRETRGRFQRLLPISRPGQYGQLPRISIETEPEILQACEACFDSSSQQADLFPEELPQHLFKRSETRRLLDLVENQRAALGKLNTQFDESLYEPFDKPHSVDFEVGSRTSHYEFNRNSGPFGPELPHCTHEDL